MKKIEDCVDQKVLIVARYGSTSAMVKGILQKEETCYKVLSRDGSRLKFALDTPCIYNEEINKELPIDWFDLGELT